MSADVYSVRLVVQQQDSGFVGKWIDDDGQESSSFPLVLPGSGSMRAKGFGARQ